MTSDENLMLEFQRGSRDAFAELFERYREPVCGFFRRRLEDRARAEELAQETFLAVLRGAERYEPRASFRTYLYAIASRQVAHEWRRAKPEGQRPAEREVAAPGANPDDALWLRRAIGQLDAAHREVLLLREYEQLSYDEIASLLHIPVNTVRSRLFRARLELKDRLEPARVEKKEREPEGSRS